jgi:transposase InsO family protein
MIMPWKEESVMSQKQKLIEKLLLPGANVTAISEEYQISRKTAYKWLKQYRVGGLDGLAERRRTPKRQPNRSSTEVEDAIIQTHKTFPYWGPYKLQQYLLNENTLSEIPSHPTIGQILKRHGCEVIKNNRPLPAKKRFEREYPNELWQMDFKGSFMTKVERCYPLTVLDDYSRFSIGLKACRDEKGQTVKSELTGIFKEFGLPQQINVDNGNPWGSADLESYTSLQIWLIKLGIRLTHSAPYHPQTNGKDERFHRTLKLEVLHHRCYGSLRDIQPVFDEWQHSYNFQRPHQGIGNKTPSSRYQASVRPFPDKILPIEYAEGDVVKKVSIEKGLISFKGHHYRAGKALAGEHVAIKETESPNQFAIFFMDTFIKKFTLNESVS